MTFEGTWEWRDNEGDPQLRMRIGNQIAVFPVNAKDLEHWTAAEWVGVLEARLITIATIDACPHDDWTAVDEHSGPVRCGRCGVIRGKFNTGLASPGKV